MKIFHLQGLMFLALSILPGIYSIFFSQVCSADDNFLLQPIFLKESGEIIRADNPDLVSRIERATAHLGSGSEQAPDNQNRPPFHLRHRVAELNVDAFVNNPENENGQVQGKVKDTNKATEQIYQAPEKLELNLFQDINLIARKTRIERRSDRDITWIGRVEGDDLSMVVITLRNDNLVAEINSNDKNITIRPMGNKVHVIYEISPSYNENISSGGGSGGGSGPSSSGGKASSIKSDMVFPTDNPAVADLILKKKNARVKIEELKKLAREKDQRNKGPTNTNKDPNNSVTTAASSTDGSFIDVMVVYTDDVRAATADIVAEITNDIAYANEALARSCVLTRLRLVHTAELNFVETEDSTMDLYCLTLQVSSYCRDNLAVMQTVTTMRNTYGADLVQMWVENNQDVCGIGWAPSLSQMQADFAYTVKIHDCPAATSIHEMGHNLSLLHDRYEHGVSFYNTAASNSEGYGFVITSLKVRDIMSYDTECSDSGFSCTRIGYFSNPRIVYQGIPFGIPGISDGVKRLNVSRVTAANYMGAVTEYSPDITSGCEAVVEKKSGMSPCLIATVSYGSFLDQHVVVLREFRDNFLLNYQWGQYFVDWYYQTSPMYAKIIEQYPVLKVLIRVVLTPIVLLITYPIINFALIIFLVSFILYLYLIPSKRRI